MSADIARLTEALADRYRIERKLGAGGMATVYLAEDLKHHRKVAVKVLRGEISATLGAERFSREISVAANLQHPHILPLLDSGESGGFFYYVMPHIDGESLRDRLTRQGELPVHEAVRIVTEVADALTHAHAQGVVHRDIKPDNIMLSGRHAMVMDFGVAKAVSEATGANKLTSVGIALGTPTYMAPEQAAADPHLDHRVDIYALGVLAYELLTGRPPFEGRTPQETLAAHVTKIPESVEAHRPGVSPALSAVIMKCLAKRAADRWQSAEELVHQLEPLATPSGGMTPTHTQPVSGVVPPTAAWRSWVPLLAAAVVLFAIVAMILRRRGDGGPQLTLTKTTRLTSAQGVEALPAISPDGQFLAYAAQTGHGSKIFLQPIDGGRAVNIIEGMPGAQISPDWSPDGHRLLFVAYDSSATTIFSIPPTGGDARRLYSVPAGGSVMRAAKWSPDGTRIAFELGDSVLVMTAEGAGLTLLARVRDVHSLAWSPDGRWLAGVRGNANFVYGGIAFGNLAASTVFVMPAVGGTPVMVSDSTTLNVSPVWLPDGRGLLYVSSGGGGRDVYLLPIDGGHAAGPLRRITTGLDAHTIALSHDGKRLAYAKYSRDLNVWMVRLSPTKSVDASSAIQLTQGNQASEVVRLSPDGKWLAYDSDLNGNSDIFIIPSDGGTPRQLTDDPSDDLAPDWSADGSQLAFHSFRTGNRDVFTVNADGSGVAQVTTDTLSDWYAVWGPDENTISFSRGEGGEQTMYEERRNSPSTPWGAPTLLAHGLSTGMTQDRSAYLFSSFGIEGTSHGDAVNTVPTGGGTSAVIFSIPPGYALGGWARRGPDSKTIYIDVRDASGALEFWAVDTRTKTHRSVLTFDHFEHNTFRGSFDTDGKRAYFAAGEHQADIWVATVEGLHR